MCRLLRMETRVCSACGVSKPVSAGFTLDRGKPFSQCRDCRNAAKRAWYQANREYVREYQRAHELTTRRKSWLKTKYGITPEQFDEMVERQGNRCALCKQPQSDHARYLDVDHCHTTQRVRGLLCRSCNTAIGLFREDPELFAAAAEYLRQE